MRLKLILPRKLLLILAILIFTLLGLNSGAAIASNGIPIKYLILFNLLCIVFPAAAVSVIIVRAYHCNRSAGMLFLGAGFWASGLGTLLETGLLLLNGLTNVLVTVHHFGALISAACFVVSSWLLTTKQQYIFFQRQYLQPVLYAGTLVLMAGISLSAIAGVTPAFFVPKDGPAMIRQVVLFISIIFYWQSVIVLLLKYRIIRNAFLLWYALALTAITFGLAITMFQHPLGGIVNRLGLTAQYLGHLCALVAVSLLNKHAGSAADMPLVRVVAEYFEAAEENCQALVETVKFAIISVDIHGRILSWNPSAEKLFGVSGSEVQGKDFHQVIFFDTDDVQQAERQLKPLQQKDLLARIKLTDGQWLSVEVSISCRDTSAGQIRTFIIKDISEQLRCALLGDEILQRKQTEEALRKNKERLEMLLAAVPDVIFHFNKAGDYLDFQAEKSTIDLYCQPEAFLGKNILDVMPRQVAEQIIEHINKAIATGQIQLLEYQIPIAGIRRYREARFIAGEAEDAFVITRDITARKQGEACDALLLDIATYLLSKEQAGQIITLICDRLMEIFDFSQVVVGLKDADGTVKLVGAGMVETHPGTGGIGRWDEDSDRTSPIGRVIRTGKPLIGQTKAELLPWYKAAVQTLEISDEWIQSYAAFPLRVEDSVIGGILLTSRHEHFWDEWLIDRLQHFVNQAVIAIVAGEFRQRLSLLQAGLHAAANAIVITDIQGRIQWANPAFTKLTGYELSEVIDQNLCILKSGRQEAALYRRLWETITSGKVWQGELINRRKDGSLYTEEMTITPVTNEQAEIVNFIAVKQDITEKLKVLEAIIDAKAARARAERLYSLGTMAAGISHEINQPLNSIKMIASGIAYVHKQGKQGDISEIITHVEEVSRQADRIANIVSHLRSFIRKGESRAEKCALNTAVLQAIEVVGKQLDAHGVQLETNLAEPLPPVMASTTSLEGIIINLLVNAMQALDATPAKEKRIILRTYEDSGVMLEVRDNGPGISPETGAKIFEPFYSTKQAEDNLGLGLAIVHSLVTACSGTIAYESDGSTGTAFFVRLPAAGNSV